MLKSLTTRWRLAAVRSSETCRSVGDIRNPYKPRRVKEYPAAHAEEQIQKSITSTPLQEIADCFAHICWALYDPDAGRRQRGHFFSGRPLPARNDRARVAHAPPGRRRLAGDEADDRLPVLRRPDPRGGVFLGVAADLAD